MRTPTVHLNGTSRDQLLAETTEALRALRGALIAVEDITVNGRDYYPQGPDALSEAQLQHAKRIRTLRALMDELIEYQGAIDKAGR